MKSESDHQEFPAASSKQDGTSDDEPSAHAQEDSKGQSPQLFGWSKLLGDLKPRSLPADTPKVQKSFVSSIAQKSFVSSIVQNSFASVWSRSGIIQELKRQARKQKARQAARSLMKALLQAESQARFNLSDCSILGSMPA